MGKQSRKEKWSKLIDQEQRNKEKGTPTYNPEVVAKKLEATIKHKEHTLQTRIEREEKVREFNAVLLGRNKYVVRNQKSRQDVDLRTKQKEIDKLRKLLEIMKQEIKDNKEALKQSKLENKDKKPEKQLPGMKPDAHIQWSNEKDATSSNTDAEKMRKKEEKVIDKPSARKFVTDWLTTLRSDGTKIKVPENFISNAKRKPDEAPEVVAGPSKKKARVEKQEKEVKKEEKEANEEEEEQMMEEGDDFDENVDEAEYDELDDDERQRRRQMVEKRGQATPSWRDSGKNGRRGQQPQQPFVTKNIQKMWPPVAPPEKMMGQAGERGGGQWHGMGPKSMEERDREKANREARRAQRGGGRGGRGRGGRGGRGGY